MDPELVLKAQAGDERALATLIATAGSRLRSIAWSILRDADRADDAAQQALITIWRNLPGLRDAAAFESWSYRLIVNACHAERRHARELVRDKPDVEIMPALGEDVADEVSAVAVRDQLERAFLRLPTHQRAVVALHHQHDLTLQHVAEVLGVPVGTVWSRLHRAMDGLRASIESDDRGEVPLSEPDSVASWTPRRVVRPWLAGGARPAPATADGREIVVAQDGTGDATSIATAVRIARDGDLVLVRPGTYRESVVVTRDIAIVGDGDRDEVVVDFRQAKARVLLESSIYSCNTTTFGFLLKDTRASLVNLTIEGPRDAVAVIIQGGAPSVRHVAASLDGIWRGSGFLHHFVFLSRGAGGTIADCVSRAHVHLEEASSPTIEHNELSGALAVHHVGSNPMIRDNSVIVATRTRWCLGVNFGASPIIERNELSWVDGPAIVVKHTSRVTMRGNVIRDSRTGIWIADAAVTTIEDNDVEARTTGILIHGSDPFVARNVIRGSASGGIVLTRGSRASLDRNTLDLTGTRRSVGGSPARRPILVRAGGLAS